VTGDDHAVDRAAPSVDYLAALAALLAVVMGVVYVRVVAGQDESPAAWVLAVLATGAGLCVYGARRRAAHRTAALAVAGCLLLVLGLLAILTIGLPILAAGALAFAASSRSVQRPTGA
jgi:hypothetical protein